MVVLAQWLERLLVEQEVAGSSPVYHPNSSVTLQMTKLVVAKTFNTRQEAEVAKSFLEANEIKALITADDAGGMYPFQLSSTGVKLLVSEKELKKAQKLLRGA